MVQLIIIYLLTILLAMVGSAGVLNREINKVTTMIHYTGLLVLCVYTFVRFAWWHVLLLIIVNIVAGFVTYAVFSGMKK